ncbi:MAG: GxxExxY protein [Chitinophagaceae bacterium]|nr:MAG: GxxExxY protein [Chitinophagaceae bacterium]
MTENQLAKIAVDICYKIHSALGPGLLESVYESAFAHELDKLNIPYKRQQGFDVVYNGINMGMGFRTDVIVDLRLILEFKSVECLQKVHHKILLTYLKLSGITLGLLINFNVPLMKDGIFRKINGQLTK